MPTIPVGRAGLVAGLTLIWVVGVAAAPSYPEDHGGSSGAAPGLFTSLMIGLYSYAPRTSGSEESLSQCDD